MKRHNLDSSAFPETIRTHTQIKKMESKSYESITFEVEKNLKKPEEFYPLSGIKDIFSSLFYINFQITFRKIYKKKQDTQNSKS